MVGKNVFDDSYRKHIYGQKRLKHGKKLELNLDGRKLSSYMLTVFLPTRI
jgi:hypothetical protein